MFTDDDYRRLNMMLTDFYRWWLHIITDDVHKSLQLNTYDAWRLLQNMADGDYWWYLQMITINDIRWLHMIA